MDNTKRTRNEETITTFQAVRKRKADKSASPKFEDSDRAIVPPSARRRPHTKTIKNISNPQNMDTPDSVDPAT